MTSEVRIANMALSHLGCRGRISSLSEASEEARQCSLHYDAARDETLAAAPWPFAAKRKALALSAEEPPPDFSYAFEYPVDCLAPRSILSLPGARPPRFEIGVDSGLTRRLLFADQPDPVLLYTARVTNPALYTPHFAGALAFRLAAAVALPMTGKHELAQALYALYARAVTEASAIAANGAMDAPAPDAEWIRDRG